MEGTIRIKNLTGRHKQFRIDHQEVCVKIGRCLCKTGRRGAEALTVHVPGNATSGQLPAAVTLSAEIRRAANGKNPSIEIIGAEPRAKANEEVLDGNTGRGDNRVSGSSKGGTGRDGQKKHR